MPEQEADPYDEDRYEDDLAPITPITVPPTPLEEDFEEDSEEFEKLTPTQEPEVQDMRFQQVDESCKTNDFVTSKQREWIQQHCATCMSSITLENYKDSDFKELISIRMYNDDTKKFNKGECMFLSDFQDALKLDLDERLPFSIFAIYKKTPGAKQTSTGIGSLPDYTRLIFILNLSNGSRIFIDLPSALKIIATPSKEFFAVPLYGGKRRRIGNLGRVHGISLHHGQVTGYRVYTLFTKEELKTGLKDEPEEITQFLKSLNNPNDTNAAIKGIKQLVVAMLSTLKPEDPGYKNMYNSLTTASDDQQVFFSDIVKEVKESNTGRMHALFKVLEKQGSPIYKTTSFLLFLLVTDDPNVHNSILEYAYDHRFTADQPETFLLTHPKVMDIMDKFEKSAVPLERYVRDGDVTMVEKELERLTNASYIAFDISGDAPFLSKLIQSTKNPIIHTMLLEYYEKHFDKFKLYHRTPRIVIKMILIYEYGDEYAPLVTYVINGDAQKTTEQLIKMVEEYNPDLLLDILVASKHADVQTGILDFTDKRGWTERLNFETSNDKSRRKYITKAQAVIKDVQKRRRNASSSTLASAPSSSTLASAPSSATSDAMSDVIAALSDTMSSASLSDRDGGSASTLSTPLSSAGSSDAMSTSTFSTAPSSAGSSDAMSTSTLSTAPTSAGSSTSELSTGSSNDEWTREVEAADAEHARLQGFIQRGSGKRPSDAGESQNKRLRMREPDKTKRPSEHDDIHPRPSKRVRIESDDPVSDMTDILDDVTIASDSDDVDRYIRNGDIDHLEQELKRLEEEGTPFYMERPDFFKALRSTNDPRVRNTLLEHAADGDVLETIKRDKKTPKDILVMILVNEFGRKFTDLFTHVIMEQNAEGTTQELLKTTPRTFDPVLLSELLEASNDAMVQTTILDFVNERGWIKDLLDNATNNVEKMVKLYRRTTPKMATEDTDSEDAEESDDAEEPDSPNPLFTDSEEYESEEYESESEDESEKRDPSKSPLSEEFIEDSDDDDIDFLIRKLKKNKVD